MRTDGAEDTSAPMTKAPGRVSVAVPLFNEEENIEHLYVRIAAVLDSLPGGPHEIVFVDDGSGDRTINHLEDIASRDRRVVVVALSRNFGHQAALSAALDFVSGDAVVLMDGDLQDPPEAIPTFLQKHAEGFDVVYATRIRRKEAWPLRLSYFLFYRLMRRLSDISVPVDAGDFGLMSRRVVDEIRRTPERQRYLRGLRSWVGFTQVGVEIERRERSAGESKYSLGRLVALALDGMFAFSVVPLRMAAMVGAMSMTLVSFYAMYAVYARVVLGESPQGFTALFMAVWFFAGVNMVFLGVIGEYVGRIYEETKARPKYIVSRMMGAGVEPRGQSRAETGGP